MLGCIIQANRYGWDGTEDYCLRKIDDKYIVELVIEKIKKISDNINIVIAVPQLDENAVFHDIAESYGIKCYFGSIANVLDRLINAAELTKADIIIKTLGQNCFLDVSLIKEMINKIETGESIDFIQPPDDFETKFSAEIFRKKTLFKIKQEVENSPDEDREKYFARPMSFVKIKKDLFNTCIYENTPIYTKEYLLNVRELSKKIFDEGETTGFNANTQIESGNFFLGRYKFASEFIKNTDAVLDIACGSGYGTDYIYRNVTKKVIGADISETVVCNNRKNYPDIEFKIEDATCTSFHSNSFDVAISTETIEHIPIELVDKYLLELKRILKEGGRFICTTPQNSNGDIPMNPWHVKEYSLSEFKSILSRYFTIERVYGSKNGLFSNDEKGNGMMAVCRKCER